MASTRKARALVALVIILAGTGAVLAGVLAGHRPPVAHPTSSVGTWFGSTIKLPVEIAVSRAPVGAESRVRITREEVIARMQPHLVGSQGRLFSVDLVRLDVAPGVPILKTGSVVWLAIITGAVEPVPQGPCTQGSCPMPTSDTFKVDRDFILDPNTGKYLYSSGVASSAVT